MKTTPKRSWKLKAGWRQIKTAIGRRRRYLTLCLCPFLLVACSGLNEALPQPTEDIELVPLTVVVNRNYLLPKSYGAQSWVRFTSYKRADNGTLTGYYTASIDNRSGRYRGQLEVYYNSRWNYVTSAASYAYITRNMYIANFPGYRLYFRYCSFVGSHKTCPSQAYLQF